MHDIKNDLRTVRFWREFLKHGFAAVGVIAVLLEIRDFIVPGELPVRGWALGLTIAVISFAYGLFHSWPRPIEQDFESPKTRIRILKGDLFDQGCHIVVGICDTFDTEVPAVIAKSSVQGQALERLYGNDVNQLNLDLVQALAGQPVVGTIAKAGNQDKYGIGAVATVRHGPSRAYFLAYTEMDEHNEASATIDGVWKSLSSLWQEVSRTANGETVAMPVLGGGQSRISHVMPAQDAIRLMVLSFMFACRTKRVCDELRIVVRPQDFERLDRLQLQAFLDSMRAS